MANELLLSYRPSTMPGPLQAGIAPLTSRIDIAAFFNGKEAGYCNKIQIAIPVGPGDDALSAAVPLIAINTTRWVIETTLKLKGTMEGMIADQDYAVFTLAPKTVTDQKLDYNLIISFTATTNDNPGIFTCLLREYSKPTTAGDFTERNGQLKLEKTSPAFYLKNFIATDPKKSTVSPCTEFTKDSIINFSWESNGTWFQLFCKNEAKAVWEGNTPFCNELKATAHDQTYILSACVIGKPGKEKEERLQPIYLYDALTIIVSNPELKPSALEVTGAAKLHNTVIEGTLNVIGKTSLHNTSLEGELNVGGKTLLHETRVESNLEITGKTFINDVEFKKGFSVPSSSINALTAGTFTADSNAQLNGTTKAKNLEVSGTLSLPGQSSIIGLKNGDVVKTGTYTAQTDLLITANISGQGKTSDSCFGTVSIISDGRQVNASGGHVEVPWGGGHSMSGAVSAFIRKGAQYELKFHSETSAEPAKAFYRWSIGAFNEATL